MISTSLRLAATLAICSTGLSAAKVQIESMRHDIQQIKATNFDGIIAKFRDSSVSSVWFFKDDNKADEAFLAEYNKVASELKGMAKVTAMNCNDFPVFCDKQGVK
ncbi:unnamed protein product, partial [Polarella glacialis]